MRQISLYISIGMASIEFQAHRYVPGKVLAMRLMLSLAGLLWCVMAAHAQRTYILTVGYDETAEERGGHDHYAHDARDIERLLVTKCAQPVAGAFCLEGTNATLAAFTEKLKLIRQGATNKDLVILFFSVHGETSKEGDFSIELAYETLTGKALAEAFDTLRGSVLLMLDTCGAGGMLNHSSNNTNVSVLAGCRVDESTSGGRRMLLHGFYANGIHAAFSGAADDNHDGKLTAAELDAYLRNPKNIRGSKRQTAVSFMPGHMEAIQVAKP